MANPQADKFTPWSTELAIELNSGRHDFSWSEARAIGWAAVASWGTYDPDRAHLPKGEKKGRLTFECSASILRENIGKRKDGSYRMTERDAGKVLARLVGRRVFEPIRKGGPKPGLYRIEKNYELWLDRPEGEKPHGVTPCKTSRGKGDKPHGVNGRNPSNDAAASLPQINTDLIQNFTTTTNPPLPARMHAIPPGELAPLGASLAAIRAKLQPRAP